MRDVYFKVWEIAKKEIYHFIKLYQISKIHYTFEDYFNHITTQYKIKTLPHHFSDEAILGLTLIDNLGISFSYESESSPNRQNFTKCHELGHLVLQHSGTVFAENAQTEREHLDYKSLLKVTAIDVKSNKISVEVGNIFDK